MLTPAFELHQDVTFLKILIKARYAKVTEVETYVDGTDFKFYAKPYFLRLHLPGRVIEDGREKAKYDVDSGSFEITLPKEKPGEVFEGLDMLTKLLAPSGQRSAQAPCIEVTAENVSEASNQNNENDDDDLEEIDWQVEQQPFQQEEDSPLLANTSYGFANKRSGVFQRLQEELCDIVDVPDPDSVQPAERRQARACAESQKFDQEHYLADLYQDDSCIDELINHKPAWHQEWKALQTSKKMTAYQGEIVDEDAEIVLLTEDEKEQMRRLPRRQHLIDGETERSTLLSLVDIIYAYAYNVRTTLSENSVESAWTICKLSPTLSWLDWFTTLDEVVTASYRRALCYPLYRHWELANKVFQDVKRIFHLGRRRILKCLLEIHHILASDEPRYILNELYIADYCIWVQSISKARIASLAKALKKVKVTKSKIGFQLKELEQAAELVQEEASQDQSDEESQVHQYGYPHTLHDILDSGSTGTSLSSRVGRTSDRDETLKPEDESPESSDFQRSVLNSQETRGGADDENLKAESQPLNFSINTEGHTLVDNLTQGKVAHRECSSDERCLVNEMAAKLSALELRSGNSNVKSTSSSSEKHHAVSKAESVPPLSQEAWCMEPPSKKITVFGEDRTLLSDENKEELQLARGITESNQTTKIHDACVRLSPTKVDDGIYCGQDSNVVRVLGGQESKLNVELCGCNSDEQVEGAQLHIGSHQGLDSKQERSARLEKGGIEEQSHPNEPDSDSTDSDDSDSDSDSEGSESESDSESSESSESYTDDLDSKV